MYYLIYSLGEATSGDHGLQYKNEGYWSERLKTWADLKNAHRYNEYEVSHNLIAFPFVYENDAQFVKEDLITTNPGE
jgi:hypothetical protein